MQNGAKGLKHFILNNFRDLTTINIKKNSSNC